MPINWDIVKAMTRHKYIPVVQDAVYKSNPLFIHLDRRNRIVLDGGISIREPVLYKKQPVTWYTGFDTLDITPVDPVKFLELQWKEVHVPVTIDRTTELANAGEPAVVSVVETLMQNARMTIQDAIGTALFNDGTAPKEINGLREAINIGNTYAGINRATDSWWNAAAKYTTAAEPTFTLIQRELYGKCTQGDTAPDLIVTTQAIWDKLWAQAIPQQRFDDGDEFTMGRPYIRHNRARIMVDSHCPPRHMFVLNTEFIKLVVHRDSNFEVLDWIRLPNQMARLSGIVWAGNLVVQNPRFCAVATNLNE